MQLLLQLSSNCPSFHPFSLAPTSVASSASHQNRNCCVGHSKFSRLGMGPGDEPCPSGGVASWLGESGKLSWLSVLTRHRVWEPEQSRADPHACRLWLESEGKEAAAAMVCLVLNPQHCCFGRTLGRGIDCRRFLLYSASASILGRLP